MTTPAEVTFRVVEPDAGYPRSRRNRIRVFGGDVEGLTFGLFVTEGAGGMVLDLGVGPVERREFMITYPELVSKLLEVALQKSNSSWSGGVVVPALSESWFPTAEDPS